MIAERLTAAALVLAVFVLYMATYASMPAADGHWVVGTIDASNLELIFNPPSLLTHVLFFGLKRLADALGVRVSTLTIIQVTNALAAGIGVALLYRIVRLLGGSWPLAVSTGALLAVSFGYWRFANGELQLISLVVLLCIFWLIVRARGRGTLRWQLVLGVAALNALAVLLRQENVLFGLAAVTLLCVGRRVRPALRDALVYAIVGSVATWTAAIVVGLAVVPGVQTVGDAARWYLWLTGHIQSTQEFQGFEYATRFDVPRVVKGQLTAFVVGTEAVVDVIRDRSSVGYPKVAGLVTLTVAAYAMLATLIAGLSRIQRLREAGLVAVAIACAVWILTYKLIFHAWLWPTVTKYQVVTVPPLILLLVLGVIALQKSADPRRSGWRLALVTAMALVVFGVDYWGGILPARRYGDMMTALEARRAVEFRADDLFVSCESGIDPIFARLYRGDDARHVSVKNEFVKHPSPEAVAVIREAIAHQLADGGRVFVYNFVPAPYSLIAINQSPQRAGQPLSVRDFEIFFDDLRKTYAVRPIFTYWEESKAPLYLFGERQEPFFELSRRS